MTPRESRQHTVGYCYSYFIPFMNAYVKEYLLMLVAEPFKCGRKEAKIYILSDRGWTDGQEGPP